MNQCFQTPCKTGFNHLKLASSGAFSFSVESSKSGLINNSTKFIGCENDKCCACYGPNSDEDYCAPGCKAINGGTVLTDDDSTEIHAWFWVRTSLPKRVWKKCMEYEKMENGKIFKWHVDEHTNVPKKGPCSSPGDVKFNDGVAVVDNNRAMEKLPNIEGLLSYRVDNQELYLRGKQNWNSMAMENEILELEGKLGASQHKLETVQTSQNNLRKELAESNVKISELSTKMLQLQEENKIYSSCKSALDTVSNLKHGVYKIRSPSIVNGYSNVYCHMTSLPGCSGGGWTLVMKINGRKETFDYGSSYWSNKVTYNPGGGQTGFDDQETKLATYWNMPFKEICLGMKVNDHLNFISISYQASSLYNVIADGRHRSTNIGRSKWLSLVQGSGLQPHCTLDGFNVHSPRPVISYPQAVRIGTLGNEQGDCNSSDSYIGFGGISYYKRIFCRMPKITNTCGNVAYCMPGGGNKELPAMGYIFVR